MNKVALFDFCETLVNFQTADAYVWYVLNRVKSTYPLCRLRGLVYRILKKSFFIDFLSLLFPKSSINKRLVLWQIKGVPKADCELFAINYYQEIIKPNFISTVVSKLEKLKKDGYKILIVSGGYELYLKHFMSDYNLDISNLIAVKIDFGAHNKCKGRFLGGDRLYDKPDKIFQKINQNNSYILAFSDSISDREMLDLANVAYVVRRKGKNKWDINNKYKEIIWED